jgi:putative flippase GtrA
MPKFTHSISWFAVIGACAALVHYIAAVAMAYLGWLSPAYANFTAFLIAFPVSYFGHRHLSFAAQDQSHFIALPRFLLVAVSSFIANQVLLISLLHYTALPFWFVLGVVMVLVAFLTYLSSKYWAFAHG